jgi:hypothetical protein
LSCINFGVSVVYIIINFMIYRINWDMYKLIWTPILIKNKNKSIQHSYIAM